MGPKPKTSQKTGIARKLAMGTPLVASASGVKGGRGANRAFGMLSGVTAGKKGIKVDPLGVAMAVSPFKLAKVARGLFAAGKVEKATAVGMRAFAKTGGAAIGKELAGGGQATFKVLGKEIQGTANKSLMSEVRNLTRKIYPKPEVARPNPIRQLVNESRSKTSSATQSKKWLADHAVNPIENRMAVPRKTTVSPFQKMEREMYSNRPKWIGKIVNPKKGPKSK